MKILFYPLIILILLTSPLTFAADSAAPVVVASKDVTAKKSAILVEYISWFETLKLKGPNMSSETSALYYGVSVLYDFTRYSGSWGYGGNAGYAQGYTGAGNSISTATYSQSRVPWQALRAGARIFQRFSPRFELGSSVAVFYKTLTWPTSDSGNAPVKSINPSGGLFLEMRWRLNKIWELQQAVGMFDLNASVAWRIGLGYAF